MVELKEKGKEVAGEPTGFSKEDFMAIEGLKGSFFNGETHVVHKVQGKKLVARKLAKEVKVDLVEVVDEFIIVTDIKKK